MLLGSKYIFIDRLTSTNSHAALLLRNDDLCEGTIIRAGYQSAGRGQLANTWESEEGKNLTFSIILYPTIIFPAEQFLISMTISLGISDFLKRYSDICTIKWPNDIYVGNDKIAGILIEHSVMGNEIKNTIAGIGLNINQIHFLSDAPNPVSLKMITGNEYDLELILSQLLSDIDKRYKQLISGDFSKIKKEYIRKLYRLNEWYDYRDSDGLFKGRIVSVTDEGRLLIEDYDEKLREYSFKELDFIL
jgi:BirA family biotin operon repressor/biotin-[acetyl-CoA-carboxylase] ligase